MKRGFNSISIMAATLLAGLVIGACDENEKAIEVSLDLLSNSPANYNGRQVLTRGKVQRFEDPLHYWIEDEDLHRVEIFPQVKVAPYLGETVVVRGQFSFESTAGRRLTLTDIKRQ